MQNFAWETKNGITYQKDVSPSINTMTLGYALTLQKPWRGGCACMGGRWCCLQQAAHAKLMIRAAHIVAKLLKDAGEK